MLASLCALETSPSRHPSALQDLTGSAFTLGKIMPHPFHRAVYRKYSPPASTSTPQTRLPISIARESSLHWR